MRSDPAYKDLLALAGDKRPTQELYRVQQDTANIRNVADNPEYSTALKTLAETLRAEMKRTGDPQSTGQGAIFDSYPYHGDKH